jgi:hypothetical protein
MNSFTKLRDGSWGIKVRGSEPSPGQTVEVSKKDKTTDSKVVDRVIWSSADGREHLCTVRGASPPVARARSGSSYRPQFGRDYCGGRCPVRGHRCTADNPCHDCE